MYNTDHGLAEPFIKYEICMKILPVIFLKVYEMTVTGFLFHLIIFLKGIIMYFNVNFREA